MEIILDFKGLTAPCGLACFACPTYKDNITDEVAQRVASMMGMKVEDAPCDGCRSEKGCIFGNILAGEEGCLTKKCVYEKSHHNCSECTGFPCDKLMPVADKAANLPHYTKMYNLSRIKLNGLDDWAEEAALIQQKYYQGIFVYGTAPALEDPKE